MVSVGLGRTALRFDSKQNLAAAGCEPSVSGTRGRLALRKGNQQRDGFDNWRTTKIELRITADEQAGVHRSGYGGSTGSATVFCLRRGAEQQRTRDAGRSIETGIETAGSSARAGAASGRSADSGHTRAGGVCGGAFDGKHQHRIERAVRDVGRNNLE